jgi:hypothetical protein
MSELDDAARRGDLEVDGVMVLRSHLGLNADGRNWRGGECQQGGGGVGVVLMSDKLFDIVDPAVGGELARNALGSYGVNA